MSNRKLPNPIGSRTSFRLSLQYSFLYSVLAIFIFTGAYLFTQHELTDWAQEWMEADAQSFSEVQSANGDAALIAAIESSARTSFEQSRIYGLFDAQGTQLAGNIVTPIPFETNDFVDVDRLDIVGPKEEDVSGYWMRRDSIGAFTLIQGSSDQVVAEVLETLGTSLIVGFLFLAAFGVFLGVRVGKLTGDRVAAISKTLAQAGAGQLDARLPENGPRQDDLSIVETGINSALERVEHLVETQRQISVDIAHDLRRPLQKLWQRLETMTPDDNFEDQRAEGLASITEIVETFDALLMISELENQPLEHGFGDVELVGLLSDLRDVFVDAADNAGICLSLDLPEAKVFTHGNRRLLSQLFANLIDNALKHAQKATTLEISLRADQTGVSVIISDDGIGVPKESQPYLFDRFYRADSARQTPGHGLGLSLAQAIASAHQGSINLQETQKDTTFLVSLECL